MNALSPEARSPCVERGVSSVLTLISTGVRNSVSHSTNFTTEILNTICVNHGSAPVTPSFSDPRDAEILLDSCVSRGDASLNISCTVSLIRASKGRRQIYSTLLQNVSVLIVGKTESSSSYACFASTIRYHYMFLSAEWMQRFILSDLNFGLNLSILIPTEVEVISGHCEETIHVLGRAALFFTMSSEWKDDEMSNVHHILRYHAYMIAVSEMHYPLDRISPYGYVPENTSCQVRRVVESTDLPTNWRFIMLCVALAIIVLILISGFACRYFAGQKCEIGSTHWILFSLIAEAQRQGATMDTSDLDTLLEVVDDKRDDSDQDEGNRGMRALMGKMKYFTSLFNRRKVIRAVSEEVPSEEESEGDGGITPRSQNRNFSTVVLKSLLCSKDIAAKN